MAKEIPQLLLDRLQNEQIIWLTTLREDGMPLPTPVWFHWDGETVLISTQHQALKSRNIRRHPKVALNFNTDAGGGSVAVIQGEAVVVDQAEVSEARLAAYLDKYREGMKYMNMTEDGFKQFSTAKVIVTLMKTRA